MSDKLISAEEVIQLVKDWGRIRGREGAAEYFVYALREKIPAVDAEPVRHGEWVLFDATSYDVYICSECGGFAPSGFIKSNYCPNCGAKMRGKTE